MRNLDYPELKTVFIGGGTPSAIPADLLADFLKGITGYLMKSPQEFTIELNPESVTKELLNILEENRINRISVGVQSLDDGLLKTLGRNTNAKTTLKALDIIKQNWNGLLSFDLINSVPEQKVVTALNDIKIISKFNPDHISLYSLTFEPSTKLYNMLKSGKINTLPEKIDSAIQMESIDLLESYGLNRYEISNYAKEGCQSLHNINYWEMGSYAGVGPSAASTLMSSDGPVRIICKRDISTFIISKSIEERMELELLNPKSFLLEHLMMGFRLLKGIDKERVNSIFKFSIEEYLRPVIGNWMGKLIITEKSIELTEKGLSLLNPFLVDIAFLIDRNPPDLSTADICWPIIES